MQNIEQYSVSLFGTDNNNSIFTVFLILGIIVIVCLFIVIFTFICYKKIHSYNIEQIVYLSLSTIILILGYIFGIFGWDNENNPKMCHPQAIMIIIGEMSQYFWSTLIIYTLYDTLYNFEHASKASVMKRRIIHFLIGFGIPIIIAIIAIIAKICTFTGESDKGYWCSIQSSNGKPFLVVLFVIIWLSIFLNMYLLFKVKSFFKILLLKEERHIVNKDLQKLTCYPIIQMIAVLPDSLGKLIMLFKDDKIKIIQTITLIVTLLQGLCIAIIFGAVSNVLKRLFCCKKEKVEISEIENTKEIVDTPKKKNNMKSSFLDVFDGDGKEVISEGDVESGGLMY